MKYLEIMRLFKSTVSKDTAVSVLGSTGSSDGTMERLKYLVILFLAISFAVFVYHVVVLWSFTADDSFIAFRYAENLALGHGPTFNAGQTPVEGYTTFLWMLIMAIPHFFGIEVVNFAKCTGIVLTLTYEFVAFKLVGQFFDTYSKWVRFFAGSMVVLLLSACPSIVVHAVSGMGTALYTFLITFFFFLTVKYLYFPSRRLAVILVFIGLLLGLTRPEGNLIVVLGLATTLALSPRGQRAGLISSTILLYILPGGAYFLWRVLYYGQLLPMPFYIKISGGGLFQGIGDVGNFLGFISLHVGILVFLGFTKLNRKFLPAVISCIGFIVFFCFPEHMIGYNWRFLFPILPFIFVIAAIGVFDLQKLLQPCLGTVMAKRSLSTAVFVAICMLFPLGIIVARESKETSRSLVYSKGLSKAHIALGKKLRELGGPENSFIVAIADAGAVPYYSKWKAIDTFGINDVHIAMSGKHDPQYVLDQNPDVVVLISHNRDKFEPIHEWEHGLLQSCLLRGMVKVSTYEFESNYYYLWVMATRKNPIVKGLRGWK